MSFSLVSTAHNSAAATTVSVNKPSGGWNNGNILIAIGGIVASNGNGNPSAPSGWTPIDSDSVNSNSASMYHVCGASEPSSYSFGGTSTGTIDGVTMCVLEYSGQASSSPIHKHSIKDASGSKTASFNAITTTVNGCQIIAGVATNTTAIVTAIATPSGFTFEVDDFGASAGAFAGAALFDQSQATAGTVASQNSAITTTTSAANTFWGGYYIAIAPSTGTSLSSSATMPNFTQAAILTAKTPLSSAGTIANFTQVATLSNIQSLTLASSATINKFTEVASLNVSAKLSSAATIPPLSQQATLSNVNAVTSSATMPTFSQSATIIANDNISSAQTIAPFTQTATLTTPSASLSLLSAATFGNFTQAAALSFNVVVGGRYYGRHKRRYEYILPNGMRLTADSEKALIEKVKHWRVANEPEKPKVEEPEVIERPASEPDQIPQEHPIEWPEPLPQTQFVTLIHAPTIPAEIAARLALAEQERQRLVVLASMPVPPIPVIPDSDDDEEAIVLALLLVA